MPIYLPTFSFGTTVEGSSNAVETFSRLFAYSGGVAYASGTIRGHEFTSPVTTQVISASAATSGTAAGATPTLCRIGLYIVDSGGNADLVAATANDTSLFGSSVTLYTRNLVSPVTIIAGQRYMACVLVVTAADAPAIVSTAPSSALAAGPPRMGVLLAGQSDLPASILSASFTPTNVSPYVRLNT